MASDNGSTNGRVRQDDQVRVAIIGVGNCANSLLQGREYYKDAAEDQFVPGLMHVNLGGYHVRDIEFVAAFDVVEGKVGKDLSEAIYTKPNNTYKVREPRVDSRRQRLRTHLELAIHTLVSHGTGELAVLFAAEILDIDLEV